MKLKGNSELENANLLLQQNKSAIADHTVTNKHKIDFTKIAYQNNSTKCKNAEVSYSVRINFSFNFIINFQKLKLFN